jgi:hypothetical protein
MGLPVIVGLGVFFGARDGVLSALARLASIALFVLGLGGLILGEYGLALLFWMAAVLCTIIAVRLADSHRQKLYQEDSGP